MGARPDWRWLDVPFPGGSVRAWIAAVAVAVVCYLVLILIKRLVIHRLARIAGRTATGADDFVLMLLRSTRRGLLVLPVLYFGSFSLRLPPHVDGVLRTAAVLALLVQLGLWAVLGIDFWVTSTRRKRLEADAASATLIGALGVVAKLVLGTILLLLVLDNLGVNVTALVTGLGIGGVAVALALQNILGDLFASLSIVLDKPFVLGDTIEVDALTGTVEDIGVKTTRLRSATGEQLIFSNSDLLKSRIRNLKRMTERHVTLTFGVARGTPPGALEKIPGLLRAIIESESQDQVRFDRAHLKRIGGWSLEIEAAWTVLTPDLNVHMDRRQAILLAILRRFAEEGIAVEGTSSS